MRTVVLYGLAALAEIAGCFSFWAWPRLGKPILWLIPGLASLACFAYLLTFVESSAAGRAYAAYGGIYISASLSGCGRWSGRGQTVGMPWAGASL